VNVLAIDQGTSATKALVVSADGVMLGEGTCAVTPRFGADGSVEQDPTELLESVISAGRAAIGDAGGVSVQAVGLGNQGETVLRWDRKSGRPLGPAISWQDRRSASLTAGLAEHAPRLMEITGLPLDPYFVAPKMMWLASGGSLGAAGVGSPGTGGVGALAGAPAGVGVITTIDAWTTHQLTGAFVTDAATASRSLLLDLDRVAWSAEACDLFGIAIESLPEVVACDATVGETDAFGPKLPVTGLIVDQQAALLAESCLGRGDAKCTYGTGAFILANTGAQAPRSQSGLAACVAWRLGGEVSYCLDGQVYTAGAAVGWLERLGLISGAAELDALCKARSAAAVESQFIPALAGLGAPFWAPDARGAWVGLSLATSREDLVWAVVSGIAAQVATLALAMAADLGQPLVRLRVDGGLTRSRALLQAQADLLQLPVEVYPSADATALGVAAVARLGAGGAATATEAVGSWTPSLVVEPAMAGDEAAERLERFRRAAETVAETGAR